MNEILVLGCGEVGSAVARTLFLAGWRTALWDRPAPSYARRRSCYVDACFGGQSMLEGVVCRRVDTLAQAEGLVLTMMPLDVLLDAFCPSVLVDARLRKRLTSPDIRAWAPLTIGIGPGFAAGETVHVAVESQWGASLGSVVHSGGTTLFSGEPRPLGGAGRERFVYAAISGRFREVKELGSQVRQGELVAYLNEQPVLAPLTGWLRGLSHTGTDVSIRDKIVEVAPSRTMVRPGISERSARISGAVESVLGGNPGPPSL